jgi:hypothetical protein
MTLSCLPRAIRLSNSTRNGYDPYPLVFGTKKKRENLMDDSAKIRFQQDTPR